MSSPSGKILVIDDERPVLMTVEALLGRQGFAVATASNATQGRTQLEKFQPDLVLLDLGLPDADGLEVLKEIKAARPSISVIILTAQDSLANAIDSIKLGAFHFISKPYAAEELIILIRRALESKAFEMEARTLRAETKTLKARLQAAESESKAAPVFKSRRMLEIREMIDRIAPAEANILLVGESGVGKEVIANLIHQNSNRVSGPLIKLNCAAFPANMIEGELFGYVKGAFTGALQDFPGMIAAAEHGTLFLDEIGEMPVDLQTRFLRVLQEREFRPLGSTRTIRADFRLISATNRNVHAAVQEGRLRQDLFYRINTFSVEIPPLRERKEDIVPMVHFFARRFAAQMNKPVPEFCPDAVDLMLRYNWPGNVRQLQNAVEYGAVLSRDGLITAAQLPREIESQAYGETGPMSSPPATYPAYQGAPSSYPMAGQPPPMEHGGGDSSLNFADREKEAILQALAKTRGNKKQAAKILGIQRPTLYNKMKRYAIEL